MLGSALGLGPSPNVTPLVGSSGVQPKAVDPTQRFSPRPKAEPLMGAIKWTLKVKIFIYWTLNVGSLSLKTLDMSKGGPTPEKSFEPCASFIKIF